MKPVLLLFQVMSRGHSLARSPNSRTYLRPTALAFALGLYGIVACSDAARDDAAPVASAGKPQGISEEAKTRLTSAKLQPEESAIEAFEVEVWLSPPFNEIRERVHIKVVHPRTSKDKHEFWLNDKFSIKSATIDGKPLNFEWIGGDLSFEIEPKPKANQSSTVELELHAAVDKSRGEDRLIITDDSVMLLWSDSWYPWNPNVWTTMTVLVHLPQDFKVVGPGVEVETSRDEDGRVAHRFESDTPLTKVSVFADRRWQQHELEGCGGKCQAFLYPAEKSYSDKILKSSRDVIEFYSKTFFPYPFKRFSFVEMEGIYARRALATFIAYSPRYLKKEYDSTGYDAHETGLQWFCHIFGGTWAEWFGDYAAILFHEHRGDPLPAIYDRFSKEYLMLKPEEDQPLISIRGGRPQSIVHGKGPRVVRTLRYVLGEERFHRTMKCLFEKRRHTRLNPDEFQKLLEQCSETNLTTFFDDWIKNVGAPRYAVKWQAQDKGKSQLVSGSLSQSERVFRTPVEIEIRGKDYSERLTVEPREAETAFNVTLDYVPLGIIVDPDNWILKHPVSVARIEGELKGQD